MTHTLALIVLLGGVYALFAFGAALKYGVTGRYDLSHAALMGVSAGTCVFFLHRGNPIWEALLGGMLAGALAGLLVDRMVLWPLRARDGELAQNGALVGGAAAFALLIWLSPPSTASSAFISAEVRKVLQPLLSHAGADGALWFGGGASIALLLLAASAVRWTRLGFGIRALAANTEAARAAGVEPEWAMAQTAFAASALAALAGLLFAAFAPVVAATPAALPAAALAASAIGGVDALWGVVLGGYAVALIQVGVESGVPSANWALIVAVASSLIIFAAPRGVFGKRTLRPAAPR